MAADEAGGEEHSNEEKAATWQSKDLTDEIGERAGRENTTQQVGQSGNSREGLQAVKAAADEIRFRCDELQRRSKIITTRPPRSLSIPFFSQLFTGCTKPHNIRVPLGLYLGVTAIFGHSTSPEHRLLTPPDTVSSF